VIVICNVICNCNHYQINSLSSTNRKEENHNNGNNCNKVRGNVSYSFYDDTQWMNDWLSDLVVWMNQSMSDLHTAAAGVVCDLMVASLTLLRGLCLITAQVICARLSVCLSVCLSVSLWAVLSSESWSDHILLLVCHRLVLVGTRYQYKEVTNYLKIILASGTLIKHITSYDIWHRQCRWLVSSETAPYKI